MKKKAPKARTTRRTLKLTQKTDPPSVVLDVEVHFGTHIIQHVAVPHFAPSLSDWTTDNVKEAAMEVASLLPRSEALIVDNAQWMERSLSFNVTAINGDLPYLHVTLRDFPLSTFTRCYEEKITMVVAQFRDAYWPIQEAKTVSPGGMSPAPGTLRDEYPPEKSEDFDTAERQRRANKIAAIQAARRAAKLPRLAKAMAEAVL